MEHRETTARGKIARLYQFITRLHNGIPYRLSKEGYALPAWHYFLEVTRRCNLRCKMCQYIEWLSTVPASEQRDGELTEEEWLDVIDQTGPLSLITFTGGEVWIRKDFPRLLERACSGRRVHFITNAVLLDEDKAKYCVELAPKRFGGRGLLFVGVSVDGTESVHEAMRGQKGAFERTINGIENLVRYRDEMGKNCPLIHVNTVITNDNLDDLPRMPEIAARAGASVVNLLTEIRGPDNLDLGHVDPATFGPEQVRTAKIDRARLNAALKSTFAEARKANIEVRLPPVPQEEILNHYDQGYDLRHMECRSIWTNVFVGSKGGVYPCFLMKVGDVRRQTLKEIWNGPEMRAFRKRRRQGAFEVCRGCCEMEYSEKAAAAARLEDRKAGALSAGEATGDTST